MTLPCESERVASVSEDNVKGKSKVLLKENERREEVDATIKAPKLMTEEVEKKDESLEDLLRLLVTQIRSTDWLDKMEQNPTMGPPGEVGDVLGESSIRRSSSSNADGADES